ncbi:hypothetical protein BMF94_3208 [Rhodotorula taiwanensis]|uniref:DUF3533 domain-containing protein n=1 Tax=Rhodotorula taiwanensis TaxID=741276 RepID=A0A2S5BA75_9BASI|nr:hypothetical protein BMF94_3208 [Rhodotorula taiwanensis]
MSEKEQDPPADFSTSIRDPRLKSQRKQAIKAVVMASILMSVAIWALLSVFWGSTYLLEHYFPNAKLYVYDFDSANNANPLLGPYVTQYMLSTLEQPTHMGVIIRDPTGKTIDDVITEIVQEKAWAAMVVNANASTMFREAIAGTGGLLNGEYAPAGALTVITEGARWFQVTDDYIFPFLTKYAQTPTLEASHAAAANFLATATPAQISGLSDTQRAALGTPFASQEYDPRPIFSHQWSGAAPLEAGLIYYIIFAFHIALFTFFARGPFMGSVAKKGRRLTFLSTLTLRFLPLLPIYLILSLSYSLINLAFLIPMNGNGHAKFGSQGGFMIFWMLNLMSLFALGFAMESMITLLTVKFIPFFLITWIILNITSSFFPATFAETFYRYGYAMPFWHSTTGAKHIMWGARDRLGLNFGVLTGWTVLNICSLTLFEFILRRKDQRKERKELSKDVEDHSS